MERESLVAVFWCDSNLCPYNHFTKKSDQANIYPDQVYIPTLFKMIKQYVKVVQVAVDNLNTNARKYIIIRIKLRYSVRFRIFKPMGKNLESR